MTVYYWSLSDTLLAGPFDLFPRCAFRVGGLDSFPFWVQWELIFGFQVTSKNNNIINILILGRSISSRGCCSYRLLSIQAHVFSVTQRITCCTWCRRAVFFIQSRFSQSKSEISRDHFECFSQSIGINLWLHGEAQEEA